MSTAGVARVPPRRDDNRLPDPAPDKRAAEPLMPARPPQPQARAPIREQASSGVVAPPPRRQRDDDRPPDPEAAARDAFKEAFVRVGQTRALAEAADAANLASRSFQAAVALQREALELSKSGHLIDAAGRLVQANGIFRLAEAEARLKAVARDRSRVAGAPTPAPPSPAEPREAPAPPAGPSRVESRRRRRQRRCRVRSTRLLPARRHRCLHRPRSLAKRQRRRLVRPALNRVRRHQRRCRLRSTCRMPSDR